MRLRHRVLRPPVDKRVDDQVEDRVDRRVDGRVDGRVDATAGSERGTVVPGGAPGLSNRSLARAHAIQDPHRGAAGSAGAATLPAALVEDEGNTGDAVFEGVPWTEPQTAAPEPAVLSEWGEYDGELVSDVEPHVFVNGGKTGAGVVQWVSGGDGGRGNQNVGSVTLVAPVYESFGGLGFISPSAWIRPGTGTVTVTRSFRGVLVGANTNAFFFTAAAAARADLHEQLHVLSSMTLHMTHILPMEVRIGQHTGALNARVAGATAADAVAALQTYIDWNATIAAFQAADIAANTPMGTVDTADLADPTFIKHLGPRTVGGVAFNDFIDV